LSSKLIWCGQWSQILFPETFPETEQAPAFQPTPRNPVTISVGFKELHAYKKKNKTDY